MAPALRRLVLASAVALAGLALVAACLPDLGPVELSAERPDAESPPTTVSTTWTTPGPGPAWLWLVLRDSRGGLAARALAIQVE